jgi:Tfp pilus assembly protein PilF
MSDEPTLDDSTSKRATRAEAAPDPTLAESRPSVVQDAQTIDQPSTPEDTGTFHNAHGVVSDKTESLTSEYQPADDRTVEHDESQKARRQAAGGQEPPVLEPGAQSGRFTLKKFHARGGMGEIWMAEDSSIGRIVALKKVRSGRQINSDKFLHEAQITGQLEHPGVVPVHELGVDRDGQPYYVMKFVHGRTLKEAIEDYHDPKSKSPSPSPSSQPREVRLVELLQIFIHLCQTVAYAHSRNVIHRDLKPDNVMVGEYGETLVLDWGLAKLLGAVGGKDSVSSVRLSGLSGGDLPEESRYGSIKGTPAYMSPEVAEGRTDAIDQVSDVYLLGGCLYHILTGNKPRHALKMAELVELARNQVPTAPRKLDPTIPKSLNAICMKALALHKEDRYPSAQALAQDVQRYLAGEPVTAYRENLVERTGRWIRKHRRGLARTALAALVVALIAGGGWLLMAAEEQRQEDLRQAEAKRLADLAKVEHEKEQERLRALRIENEKAAAEDLKRFRRLAEEMQFFSVIYDNSADKVPLYGKAAAQNKGREAIAALDRWGPNLDNLPLPAERPAARKELYEVLLGLAQLLVLDNQQPQAAILLDRAERLQPLTPAYFRLRGQKVSPPSTPAGAIDHYLLANTHLAEALGASDTSPQRSKSCGLALEQYAKALEGDREFYWAYWQMGRCFNLLGQTLEAAQAMASCVALRAESPCGNTLRGLAFATINRNAEALANFDRALAQDGDFRPARLHRGVVHWLLKNYKAAEEDFDAALALPAEQRLLPAAYYRGQLHQEKKEWRQALADYDLLLKGSAPLRDAYLKRAQVCFSLDQQADGLAATSAYVRAGRDQDLPRDEAHELRGHQLFLLAQQATGKERRKLLALALADLDQAIALKRKSAALFLDLGSVHERLGDFQSAIAWYSEELKLEPQDARTLVKRGWVWDNLKVPDYEAGRKDFAEAVRLDPKYAEAHSGLAYMSACLKRQDEALEHANLATLWAADYRVLHNVACAYAKLSEVDVERRATYEDMAIDQLARGVELWKLQRTGTDPVVLMQNESSFTASMKARPAFKKLLGQ